MQDELSGDEGSRSGVFGLQSDTPLIGDSADEISSTALFRGAVGNDGHLEVSNSETAEVFPNRGDLPEPLEAGSDWRRRSHTLRVLLSFDAVGVTRFAASVFSASRRKDSAAVVAKGSHDDEHAGALVISGS